MSNTGLLFLHGWGFRNTVFEELSKSINVNKKTRAPCLYKVARDCGDSSFERMSDHLMEEIKRPTIIVAWSMGGLVALRLANKSDHIMKIIFISSAPKMVNAKDWDQTIKNEEFEKLLESFQMDFNETMNHFLNLVSFGDEKNRAIKQYLRKTLATKPDVDILVSWLKQIKEDDQRKMFSTINNPVLFISGENDILIKPGVIKQLLGLNRGIESKIIENSGHVPFVSNVNKVQKAINGFINDTSH